MVGSNPKILPLTFLKLNQLHAVRKILHLHDSLQTDNLAGRKIRIQLLKSSMLLPSWESHAYFPSSPTIVDTTAAQPLISNYRLFVFFHFR
jgi:hypothetical protein